MNLINSTPNRFLETDANFILKVSAVVNEIELRNSFKFTDIFNDTSIHTLPEENLTKLPLDFWTEQILEPKYSNNIELITTELISKLNI